jgi:phage major head subunit gpT-like protein
MVRGLCQLNTKCAERIDLDRYRAGYLARKDHKRYQDKAVGRVNLALADTPMSLLQGDVHYADIAVAEGAEPVRVRLIAWLDMSSLFLWVTPVLLSKGQGIVQADVAESLAHVTMCDHGGIPEHFYLDNGSEYSALSEAMARLAVLSDQAFGLTLAKPYSPTSKGSIEGLFNIVEQVFKGLPGWIGTVAVSREDIEDDRIGVFKPAFAEMGGMARRHPDELVFSLLKNGFSSPCYDGQFFFDTDHPVIGEDGTTVTTVANTDGGSGAPWFLLDVSRAVRPIIWQERVSYEFQQMTKNDDDEVFFNDRYVYGVRARVNAGFGLWQLAWGSKQTLDGASYGAARAAMQGFRADGGRILGVRPSVLVVAPALESAALKIVNSEFGPGGETNEWKGTASVIVAPWLA